MPLKITRREQAGISVLELSGRLTFGPEDIMLNDEIRHALAARRTRIVMDLGDVDQIDSAGLGTLLYARAELRRAGGRLGLANLRPAHTKALRIAKLDTVFEVYGSRLEAVNNFFPERTTPRYDVLELVTAIRNGHQAQDLTHAV